MSSLPPRPPRPRRLSPDTQRRRSAPSRPGQDRVAMAIAALLILFALGTGFVGYAMVRAHTLNPLAGISGYLVPAPEDVFHKRRIYLLLLGLDYDYTTDDLPTSRDSRTDKIEAFAIDFPTKVVKSIAIPRDLDAIVQGHEDKINDAFHYGGVRNTDKVVGQLLGMEQTELGTYFDRYIILRINASKDVINAIGGLDVPVTETMNYDDNWGHLHIHFTPGVVHMNGDEAVSYARFRHDACSDPCRIKRQQQIERLVIDKLKHDKFNDVTHIGNLIDVVRRDVDTNLTVDEMKSLGWAFRDFNIADLHTTQIPFTTDKQLACCGNVLVPDEDGKAKVVADFLGDYAATATPPPADALASVKTSEITVAVLNGSGVVGVGKQVAAQLRQAGYKVVKVGNADTFGYATTQIRGFSKIPFATDRLQKDLAPTVSTIVPQAVPPGSGGAELAVVIGHDFGTTGAAAKP